MNNIDFILFPIRPCNTRLIFYYTEIYHIILKILNFFRYDVSKYFFFDVYVGKVMMGSYKQQVVISLILTMQLNWRQRIFNCPRIKIRLLQKLLWRNVFVAYEIKSSIISLYFSSDLTISRLNIVVRVKRLIQTIGRIV